MSDTTLFQYCPKIILFRNNDSEVLLARRVGEADYDQTYTFVGGKLETTDANILEGIRREKNEEIGSGVRIRICAHTSYNVHFTKSSGQILIAPHHYAEYLDGDIQLNPEEYDDYTWVKVSELATFEPKIQNIPEITAWAQQMKASLKPEDLQEI